MKKTIVFTCFLYVFSCLWAGNFASYVCNDLALKQQSCFVVFLGTIHKSLATGGKSPKTGSQIAEIENIALQCPYTGGEAVYRARVLHTALTGFTAYNDSVNCAIQGINWRKGNTQPTQLGTFSLFLNVVPNPAYSEAQFVLDKTSEVNTLIKVYNRLTFT